MKILVIGPSWIGDMMMSQSLYRLLLQHQPNVKIDVMSPVWNRPLLNYMPEIHQTLLMPFDHGSLALRKRYKLGKLLRKNIYQQALVLPNSFKSALVPFFANIPQRTGWCGEIRYGLLNDLRRLNKKAFPLMVQRYAALAFDRWKIHSAADLPKPLLWPHITVSVKEKKQVLNTFLPDNKRSIIGFCPGAEFGLVKCWPHYHYATLAEKLIYFGYQVVLLGSSKDYAIGEAIKKRLNISAYNYCHNLTGQTSLKQVIVLIAACHGIVSNDSGLMHIASALDRPLVALYGPSSPDFTPPLSYHAKVIRLTNGYHKIRNSKDKQSYHKSLVAIQPIQVLDELESLLTCQEKI